MPHDARDMPDGLPVHSDTPLQGVLDHILLRMDGADSNLHDVVEMMGARAFGPVMMLCGLFLMTPLGALPGVPAAFGLVNIAFAAQLLLRRPHPYVPAMLARVPIPHAKVSWVARVFRKPLAVIDALVDARLPSLTRGVWLGLAALVSILLSATMLPLSVIPFGVVPSAFLLGLIGLALTARDGVLMAVALGLSLGVFGFVARLLVQLLQ